MKAFARQYAETVGLNPNEIIQELDQELGMPASPEEQAETTSRVQKREELTRPQDNSLSAKISKYLPTIIIVVVVVAILGTIYAVAWGNHEKAKNQQIEQTNTKVAVSTDVKKPAKKKKSESSSTSKKEQKIVNVASAGSTFTYNVENAPSQSTIELGADWRFIMGCSLRWRCSKLARNPSIRNNEGNSSSSWDKPCCFEHWKFKCFNG